jgi:hypothetical protein
MNIISVHVRRYNSVLICLRGVGKESFPFYCISASRVLHVFMIYYTNKWIWIDGILSKGSDIHMKILHSKSQVYDVFISTWKAVLLQDGSTQYRNGHSDFQKEIRHTLFFIHCLFQGSKAWRGKKKSICHV